ncbi:MAG TPA: GAF domain-containing protein, partial [Anaerolineales bacterium]|nr:GAF domain-containing protein [Anaerolineales bacterium]
VLFDEDNNPSIFFAAPIYHTARESTPLGLLVVQYNASILQNLIVQQNELAGPNSFGTLIDENQLYLANGQNPDLLYKTVAPLSADKVEHLISAGRLPNLPPEELTANQATLAAALADVSPAEPFFTTSTQPVQQVAVVWLNAHAEWQVGFFQPQDTVLGIVTTQTRKTIPLILVIAITVAVASIGATRLLAAPIVMLTRLVERIAAGNMNVQVPVTTQDEIGRLASAFNTLTSQMRDLLSDLENQITERTLDLKRQAVQLQTAAQVAQEASALQDLDTLLNRTVTLIQDRFNFYHAGIFLLDERKEYAVLRASNSEGGKEMIRRGHRLRVGEVGIVGYVTSEGKPRIALDVETDRTHFAHPLLPETRSEMAIPLVVRGNIIGALDIQSQEPNAFDEGDVTVLEVLANQLAIAIENSRLLTDARQTLEELQIAYGKTTTEAWQKWLQRANKPIGYRFRGVEIEPISEKPPEAKLALQQGQNITAKAENAQTESHTLAVPIKLRDQAFGVISLSIEGDEVSSDFTELIEDISDRLAIALDNARLYEETQSRAMQEQVTGEIISRIRETLNIDTMLKTTIQEIGEKLNLHDIAIRIDLQDNVTTGETR